MLFNKIRAQEYMRRYGVDALIATSPVNITYFSDYRCWIDPLFKAYMMAPGAPSDLDPTAAYAIFPLEGEPAFVVSPTFAVNTSDSVGERRAYLRRPRVGRFFADAGVVGCRATDL